MVKTAVIVNDHAFVNGGQAKVAIETALALRAEGVEVCYFSGVGPTDERLIEAGVESVCLNQYDLLGDPNRARSALRGIWNREAARRFHSLLSRYDAKDTIIHVHGWAKSLSPSIGPLLTAGPIPHIYTIHEYFLACPGGGFYDHQSHAICTRRPLGASCVMANCDSRNRVHKAWRLSRQAVLWTFGAMPRALRDLIYLSEAQLKVVQQYLPADARLHHLPNPITKSKAGRIAAENNEVFLFIGRFSAEKGAEVAASAARQAGVKIAFAGEGDHKDQILAANPDAKILGWLNEEELAQWMGRSRCLVFPSLWYECAGMSIMEAMQRGLPVLVSDSTVSTEFVRHDVDGLHVATGDVDAWARAMQLLSDPKRVARYSRSSFEAAHSFLDSRSYGRRLVAIYQEAAAAQQKERQENGTRPH